MYNLKRKLYPFIFSSKLLAFICILSYNYIKDDYKKLKLLNVLIKCRKTKDNFVFERLMSSCKKTSNFYYRFLLSCLTKSGDKNIEHVSFSKEEFFSDKNKINWLIFLLEKNKYFLSKNICFVRDIYDSGLLENVIDEDLITIRYHLGEYHDIINGDYNKRNHFFYMAQVQVFPLDKVNFSGLSDCEKVGDVISLCRKKIISECSDKQTIKHLYNVMLSCFRNSPNENKILEEWKLFKLQIAISYANDSSVYMLTNRQSHYNLKSIIPALNRMIILCKNKSKNKIEINNLFNDIVFLYKKNNLNFQFVRFLVYFSTLVDKSELNQLLRSAGVDLNSLEKDASSIMMDMEYCLIVKDVTSALNLSSRLARFGTENIFRQIESNKVLHYFPIKTILYQYLFSMQYSQFDSNDYVLCDERFYNVFLNSFPNCNFIPVKRPNINPNFSIADTGLAAHDWYIPRGFDVSRFNSKPLSLDIEKYKSLTKTGWLYPSKVNFKCLDKERVNIGLSLGTGRKSKHRDIYSNPLSIVEMLSLNSDVNLVNLDYNFDQLILDEFDINNPHIDLKNDVNGYLSLISQLDFLIIMPNSNMDAAASVHTKAFVFDPHFRLSYWTQDGINYIASDCVEFISRNTYEETVRQLKLVVEEEIKKHMKKLDILK